MQGLYYLFSIIAVFIVLIWYIRNDDIPDGKPTRGLLAIKLDVEPTELAATRARRKGSRWRRQSD